MAIRRIYLVGYGTLKRPIYGLRQSAERFYEKLREKLVANGWKRTASDPCVFVKHEGSVVNIVAMHVDDMLNLAGNKVSREASTALLGRHFKLKDLGDPQYYLALQILRDPSRRTITVSQERYVLNILDRYEKSNVRAFTTPMAVNLTTS